MNSSAQSILHKLLFVFIGLVVGVSLVASFVFLKDKKIRDEDSSKTQLLALEISQPKETIATSDKTVTVAGSAKVKSLITINTSQKSTIVESSDGNFSSQVELTEGKNEIYITAFDPSSGESQTSKREILYLNEDISNL